MEKGNGRIKFSEYSTGRHQKDCAVGGARLPGARLPGEKSARKQRVTGHKQIGVKEWRSGSVWLR